MKCGMPRISTVPPLVSVVAILSTGALGRGILPFDDVWRFHQGNAAVPVASNEISFSIDGPGRIPGVDNGSVASLEPFQSVGRKAFQSRALAMVRRTAGLGKATLSARADGLEHAEVEPETARCHRGRERIPAAHG